MCWNVPRYAKGRDACPMGGGVRSDPNRASGIMQDSGFIVHDVDGIPAAPDPASRSTMWTERPALRKGPYARPMGVAYVTTRA